MDATESNFVHLGNTRYELQSITGVVEGKERMLETRTHVSGGGTTVVGNTVIQQPVTTTHSTIDHLHFFIRPAKGPEREIKLKNAKFEVRDGHIVSLTVARLEGAKYVPYVMLRNHSTRKNFYYKGNIDRLLAPRGFLIRTAGVALALLTIPAFLLPLIPFAVVAKIVRHIQRRRLIPQVDARYVPTLDQRAGALA